MEPIAVKDLLDRLARRFEDAAQLSENISDGGGWGQFLDAPKEHRQIGPYGTSAGIIVLALADRGQSTLIQKAATQLCQWWKERDQSLYVRERFVQTTRLALLHLALRLSGMSNADEIRADVERALIERLLPSGMWGNYWITKEISDPTPRLFPSAVALLSFSLFRDASTGIHEPVLSAANGLEEKLALASGLALLDGAAASAAILATKGTAVGHRALAGISKKALFTPPDLSERGAYFYDYEYLGDNGRSFGQDYFIIPTQILLGIAGFQIGAPSTLRLMAENSLESLAENFRKNSGAYCPADGARISSMDQAWAAILLKVSSVQHRPLGATARIWYSLIRQRQDNRFTSVVFPSLSMIIVTAINVLTKDAGTLVNLLGAIGTLIIGGLYGPRVLRKLFPGRE